MAARDDLQQIVLDDFSPGIWDDWSAGGASMAAPQGAAQLTGTYGCVSAGGGGLIAGPKRVNRLLETLIDADGSTKYPTNDNRVHITSFRCASPVWDRTGLVAAEIGRANAYPDNLFFGFEWYYNASGGTTWNHKQRVRLYKEYLQSAANPAIGTISTYDIAALTSALAYSTRLHHGYTAVDLTRSNSNAVTFPGYPVAGCMAMTNHDVTNYVRVMYPDDHTPTADGTRAMTGLDQSGGFAAYGLFAHQDRLFALDRSVNVNFGAGEMPTDMLIGTAVNDLTTTGVNLANYVAENPGWFGAWASVNASEAFFVKQQRGGFVARGDIQYPTIVRLPGMAPTFDGVNIPCVANDGTVIYGSTTGVYAWSGGDTSKNISTQLNGWFWKPSGGANGKDGVDTYLYTKGSFAPIENYVAAPNNFLFDIETGGWWRLTNPAATGQRPYIFHDVSAAGYLICVPPWFDATTQVLADYYDLTQGQTAFTWVSQPLKVTQNRTLDFREITLLAQGAGTVTITVTGVGGATDSQTFTITATARPEAQTLPIGVQCHDAVVTISSDSGASTAAPRIYRLTLGYNARATAAAASV